MNSVCVIGRLGRDPEVRCTGSGTAVCTLRVAISSQKKKGKDWVDHPVWIQVTCFEKQAENAGEYLSKGDEVGIEGRLDLEEWQDKKTDEPRSKHVIVAHRVTYLRKKDGTAKKPGDRPDGDEGKSGGRTERREREPTRSESQVPTTNDGFIDDDLPF